MVAKYIPGCMDLDRRALSVVISTLTPAARAAGMTLRSLTRILVLWWFAKRPATKGCPSDPWPAGQFTEPGPEETTKFP